VVTYDASVFNVWPDRTIVDCFLGREPGSVDQGNIDTVVGDSATGTIAYTGVMNVPDNSSLAVICSDTNAINHHVSIKETDLTATKVDSAH
jgi:hypothetical protein